MTKTSAKHPENPTWLKTLFQVLEYLLHWPRVLVFSVLALCVSFLIVFTYTYWQIPASPPGEFSFTFLLVLQDSFSQLVGQSVINSPISYGSPLAVYIIPSFSALFIIQCLACFFRRSLLLFLLRYCQTFTAVFGDGPIPNIILNNCRHRDGLVLHIEKTSQFKGIVSGDKAQYRSKQSGKGFLSISEAAFSKFPASLLEKCQHIIAIDPHDIDNVRFTNGLYGEISDDKSCPALVACIRSTQLKTQLTQRYEEVANSFHIPFTLIGLNEFLARIFLNNKAPDRFRFADKPQHQHALIFGLGDMGEALLKEFLRQHAYSHMKSGQPHTLSLADSNPRNLNEISNTYKQALEGFVDINTLDSSSYSYRISEEALLASCVDSPFTAIYLCLGNAQANLSAAMYLEEQLTSLGLAVPPIIFTSTEAIQQSTLLTHQSPYVAAGYFDLSMTGEHLIANFVDTLKQLDSGARILHEDYLSQRLADGEKIGDRPALQHWEQLSEFFKDDNRTLTDHLAYKLRDQGFYLADKVSSAETESDKDENAFSANEIEKLAYAEHLRWWFNRIVKGWNYAPARDDANREHPDMIPWEDLDEPAREKDRDMIRQLSSLAHSMGKQIKKRHYFVLDISTFDTPTTPENEHTNQSELKLAKASIDNLIIEIQRHSKQSEAIIVGKADTLVEATILSELSKETNLAYVLLTSTKPTLWEFDSLSTRRLRAQLMTDALQIIANATNELEMYESLDFAERKFISNVKLDVHIPNGVTNTIELKVSIDND